MLNLFDLFKKEEKRKKNFDDVSEEHLTNTELPPLSNIRDFVGNHVWKYIAETIAFRIKSVRDDLEDQNSDIDTIRVNQGRVEEMRFIENLPSFLINQYDNLKAEIDADKATKARDKVTK